MVELENDSRLFACFPALSAIIACVSIYYGVADSSLNVKSGCFARLEKSLAKLQRKCNVAGLAQEGTK